MIAMTEMDNVLGVIWMEFNCCRRILVVIEWWRKEGEMYFGSDLALSVDATQIVVVYDGYTNCTSKNLWIHVWITIAIAYI